MDNDGTKDWARPPSKMGPLQRVGGYQGNTSLLLPGGRWEPSPQVLQGMGPEPFWHFPLFLGGMWWSQLTCGRQRAIFPGLAKPGLLWRDASFSLQGHCPPDKAEHPASWQTNGPQSPAPVSQSGAGKMVDLELRHYELIPGPEDIIYHYNYKISPSKSELSNHWNFLICLVLCNEPVMCSINIFLNWVTTELFDNFWETDQEMVLYFVSSFWGVALS